MDSYLLGMIRIDQCFSNGGEFAPQGHLSRSGDTFGCHTGWNEGVEPNEQSLGCC